jgi:phospholipase B1
MAGFAMMGVDYNGTGALNLSLISEYRGNSYAMGVDTDAVTLPNFIKHYNSSVQGGSILSHIVSYCQGNSCGFPETLCKFKINICGNVKLIS